MGLNNEHAFPVYFDLETLAHERAAEFLPPPEIEFLTPPKNYTKPDTIERWKEEEKARRIKAWEDDLEKCALDPDLCRIVCLGYMKPADDEPVTVACPTEADEKAALEEFWAHTRGALLVGYNCAWFDVPILLRRSLMLHVAAPDLMLSKYRHPTIIDLMKVLTFDGVVSHGFRKLAFYLKRFGLLDQLPKDDIDGSEIARLVHEGDWDAVRHHNRCDVLGTKLLANFLGIH